MDHHFPKRVVEILNSGSLRDKHKFCGTGSQAGHFIPIERWKPRPER
jgi:hypothetical protein